MIDIDHFKEINDRFGHPTGDEVLQQVAQVLLNNTRGCDLPARYGGDEFTIVLPETSARQAWQGAERLRQVIETLSIEVSNKKGSSEKLKITGSIGVAEYPYDANSVEALIEMADQALYQAKRKGRNRVVRYRPEQKTEGESK
jgi:diguanylate cyclase (GGDEF)-like protein